MAVTIKVDYSSGIGIETLLVKKVIQEEVKKLQDTFNITDKMLLYLRFTNSNSYWGAMETCAPRMNYDYVGKLTLSKCAVRQKLKDTVMHELLHLITKQNSHYSLWKDYTDIINSKYGYSVTEFN